MCVRVCVREKGVCAVMNLARSVEAVIHTEEEHEQEQEQKPQQQQQQQLQQQQGGTSSLGAAVSCGEGESSAPPRKSVISASASSLLTSGNRHRDGGISGGGLPPRMGSTSARSMNFVLEASSAVEDLACNCLPKRRAGYGTPSPSGSPGRFGQWRRGGKRTPPSPCDPSLRRSLGSQERIPDLEEYGFGGDL